MVTGRNLGLTEKAIQEYGVRHPDILCGDSDSDIFPLTARFKGVLVKMLMITFAGCYF